MKGRGTVTSPGIAPLLGLWTQALLSFPGGYHGRPGRLPLWLKMPSISMLLLEWACWGTAGYRSPRPRATGQWSAPGTSQGLCREAAPKLPRSGREADGELSAVAGREVMDHHGQLAAAWQLGRRGLGQPVCPHHGPAAGKAGAHAQLRQGTGCWLSGGPQVPSLNLPPFPNLGIVFFYFSYSNIFFQCVTLSEPEDVLYACPNICLRHILLLKEHHGQVILEQHGC